MKRAAVLAGLMMALWVGEPLPLRANATPPPRMSWSEVSDRLLQSSPRLADVHIVLDRGGDLR